MRAWAALLFLVAACGSTPPPPPIQATAQVCTERFCVTAPTDWVFELESGAVSFTHPTAPSAVAFVSVVDMSWMLSSAGSEWPASLESVEHAYWSLLDSLAPQHVIITEGGWAESRGRYEGQPRWHAVHPVEGGPVAVAVTVHLPAPDWEPHARTFIEGVTLLP